MGKQLAKAQHHAVDEGEQQVDGRAAYYPPDRRRLVEDDGRRRGGRRRGRDVLGCRVALAVGMDRDAGLGERVGRIGRGHCGFRGARAAQR